jgi:hypothetical protein
MKHLTLTACCMVTGFALSLPLSAPAVEKPSITVGLNTDQRAGASLTNDRPAKPPAASEPAKPFIPRVKGAPDRRIGAATRGTCKTAPTLAALAPHPTGPTMHEQPALFWFVSTAVTDPIEFTLTDEDEKVILPLLETRIVPPVQPGLHQVRLADSGVRLEPGKRYQWSVSLLCDPEHPSNDIVAMGAIERAERPGEAGLWYDEVMAISEQIQSAPSDMNLRKKRASLLDQVKLSDVAAYDLRAVAGVSR